jgi:hypothetical protein
MAHPFMPLKGRKLRKLTRRRKDSNPCGSDSNRRPEFETTVTDSRRNKTSSRPPIICQIATEKKYQSTVTAPVTVPC